MIKELGRASPYGVYDLTSNAGWVNVGIDNDKVVKSTKTALDTRSWYEYIWREKQETPKRLEDAAKFIATMISISLTIFMAIGKTAFENY